MPWGVSELRSLIEFAPEAGAGAACHAIPGDQISEAVKDPEFEPVKIEGKQERPDNSHALLVPEMDFGRIRS